ncbi:hypothetical protein SRABI98_00624 [Microbacterium sp. Bi98]|uniref:hypothetical protein n=1 Tax=unclassified Microbacterium TaxID=2609290 RepID=UPI0006FE87BB|nr:MULTISPECIES: hypothetical protein [unclassified Microbacterium]KRD50551.1 hypothetical protein ASE34_13455 [Microbacterium sp. Root280D1]CAH0144458.1 hypothetical protein SRABI98_00624 [Microbacterium sp. Bi98]
MPKISTALGASSLESYPRKTRESRFKRHFRRSSTANGGIRLPGECVFHQRLSSANNLVESALADGGNGGVLSSKEGIRADEPQPRYVLPFSVTD